MSSSVSGQALCPGIGLTKPPEIVIASLIIAAQKVLQSIRKRSLAARQCRHAIAGRKRSGTQPDDGPPHRPA